MRRHRVRFVTKVLKRNRWNMTESAKALRMYRSQLYYIITTNKELTRIWHRGRAEVKRDRERKRRVQ